MDWVHQGGGPAAEQWSMGPWWTRGRDRQRVARRRSVREALRCKVLHRKIMKRRSDIRGFSPRHQWAAGQLNLVGQRAPTTVVE
jgi:hypothetical protein